ncbi:MAG TPA: ATPase, T2SS/T4P/T4SS family [Planctomycetota bacterium]|nr:ATPase, T2SS/T4P/T4SS family [Planctomycetota bacterium]
MANVAGYNRKLSALLKKHGLLDDAQLKTLNDKCAKEGALLASTIVGEDLIDEITLLGLVSEDCGAPPIDLEKMRVDIEGMTELNKGNVPLSEETAKLYKVIPIAMVGEYLTLAVANPYDVVTLDDLKITAGRQILPCVSSERAILKAIEVGYHRKEAEVAAFMEDVSKEDTDELSIEDKKEEDDEAGAGDLDAAADGEDSPAVKVVKTLMMQAIQKGASDIHIEPFEKRVRVRFRIDGVLHEVFNPPRKLHNAVVSRIKIMTDTMNIAEHGKPQDGRIQIKLAGRAVDFRVNSLPTVHGEKMCMRILDKGNLAGSLETLNFEPSVLAIIQKALASPFGMMLVTGPTGSGKSTTLYSCLRAVMTVEDNVTTVEEPVEYEIEGLNQVHVNPKRGLTFGSALRAILRQDPDTVMIGEIRDQETIEIAVKAALTGHLVLSTLHTNDAPSTISRIKDMGIEPFLISSTVLAVLAQRLGRRLCKNCKQPMTKEELPSRDQLLEIGYKPEEIEGITLHKAVGCSLCNKGYKGRFALVECLEMNDDLRKRIIAGGNSIEIRKTAIATGMITLRRAGLMNAMRGITTIDEVMRNTVGEETEPADVQQKAAQEKKDELHSEMAAAGEI